MENLNPQPSIDELYPNMNYKENEWTNEKKTLAELIKEITLVWNGCIMKDVIYLIKILEDGIVLYYYLMFTIIKLKIIVIMIFKIK